MKFVNSNWTKKLIIVLIILLLFNSIYPSLSYAVDIGGILLEPVYWLLCGIYIPVDITIGAFLVLDKVVLTDILVWTAHVFNPGNMLDNILQMTGIADLLEDIGWIKKRDVEIIGNTSLNDATFTDELSESLRDEYSNYTIGDLFVGPDTIFKGQIDGLNANIFKYIDPESGLTQTPWEKAAQAVAKFYVILRNIAATIMLAGLIFIGIRILLSANIPTKKTQYLMLLQDWLIGMAILIFSHIIMVLILELAEAITKSLGSAMQMGGIKWTLVAQMMFSKDMLTQTIALLLYHWIQILTLIFAISYFKRFFWTCVLVVFAPVFPVMYALGQQTKQIYSNWLKEFILNAMVQPFHLVVYTVLITMPLATTAASGWNWSGENFGELLYALMAMSMIKPAEKYLRRLFGMDKGIANMASYDSGKKTITDTVKAVWQVAKTAVAVYSGGTTAMLGAGLNKMQNSANNQDKGNNNNALPPDGNNSNWENENVGTWGAGDTWDNARDYLKFQANAEGYNSVAELREAYGDDGINDLLDTAGYSQKDLDDFSQEDIKQLTDGINKGTENNQEAQNAVASNNGQAAVMDASSVILNAGSVSIEGALESGGTLTDGKNSDWENEDVGSWGYGDTWDNARDYLKFQANNEGYESVAALREAYGDDGINEMLEAGGYSQEDLEEDSEKAKELEGADKDAGTDGQAINTSNLTINAGSVDMNSGAVNMSGETTNMNGGAVNVEKNQDAKDKEQATVGTNDEDEYQKVGIDPGEADPPEIEGLSGKDIFKNLGGLEKIGELGVDLFEGLGSITDGLYVDGMAPTSERHADAQWMRGNIKEKAEKRKESVETAKDNWAHNKTNIQIMTEEYLPEQREKMERKYGNSKDAGYKEEQAREKAEEKAKAALKDMSAYVPYGITDVKTAYRLYDTANAKGLNPEQTVKYMAGYQKAINNNQQIVMEINKSGEYGRNDYKTVEQAIPNAQVYYNAGYTDIADIMKLDKIAHQLRQTPEFAMTVDEVLKRRNGGKLTYNGKDAEVKKVIDQINGLYGG